MKKWICALLALLMLLGCCALAEEAPVISPADVSVVPEAADKGAAPAEEEAATDEAAPETEEPAEEAVPEADSPAEEAETEAPVEETAPETIEIPVGGPMTVGFEDGFSLELPQGWMYYELTDAMAEKGVLYCLSDATASHWLYIQRWSTDCADINSLSSLINEISQPQTSGVYNFNGTDFIVYDLTEGDVSCCAALLDGKVINLVFTPQSDADFMVTAAQIIGSFTVL